MPASPGSRTRVTPGRGFDACAASTMWSICRLNAAKSAERRRIEHLDEHRAAPAFRRIGTAVAGQARGQRFDEQREAEALVAGVEAAQREERPFGLGGEDIRIVGRVARVVDDPCARQLLAGLRLLRGRSPCS